jgi:catechol 2,3-dioxygenase-like lactoylglutathione lyase family enzyme
MITGARFVTLYVRDQQKALDFWTKKLGFEVLTDAPYSDEAGGDARWIEVKAPKGETYFVLHTANAPHDQLVGTMSHVWLSCDDLDATFNDLKGKGVEFPVEPSDAPWAPGSRWMQFTDPDGNLYGVSEG